MIAARATHGAWVVGNAGARRGVRVRKAGLVGIPRVEQSEACEGNHGAFISQFC
jgi:hypothetical protein